MSKVKESTRQERQAASIRSFYGDESLVEAVRKYAEVNQMSVSEVMREAIDLFMGGLPVPKRQRITKRITFWVAPDRWGAFLKAASRKGVSATEALKAGLEDML